MEYSEFAVLAWDIHGLSQDWGGHDCESAQKTVATFAVRQQLHDYLHNMWCSMSVGVVLCTSPEKVFIQGGTVRNVMNAFCLEIRRLLFNNTDEVIIDVMRDGRAYRETILLLSCSRKCSLCVRACVCLDGVCRLASVCPHASTDRCQQISLFWSKTCCVALLGTAMA